MYTKGGCGVVLDCRRGLGGVGVWWVLHEERVRGEGVGARPGDLRAAGAARLLHRLGAVAQCVYRTRERRWIVEGRRPPLALTHLL